MGEEEEKETRQDTNLCFSPPEIINPLSPTFVPYFSGNPSIVFATLAFLHASLTSSSVASILPYLTLCMMSAWNKGVSWGTTPMALLRLSSWISEMG